MCQDDSYEMKEQIGKSVLATFQIALVLPHISYEPPVPHHLSHQSVTAEAWMMPLIPTREAPSIMAGFLPT